MYLGRLGARRQTGFQLDSPEGLQRLRALCGGESVPAVPHGDTVADYLASVDPADVQRICQQMVRALLESRRLEGFRLLDRWYLVAVDLSGHLYLGNTRSAFTEGCLTMTAEDGRTLYYRPVCEAKLITRTGLALSLGSEFLENPSKGRGHACPQDSELPAAGRLIPRVKEAFPGYSFCALLDGRYANETGFALCQAQGWRFIITLQQGSLPTVWQESQTLRRLAPENRLIVETESHQYHYTWANGIATDHRRVNVLECVRTSSTGQTNSFAWVTDIEITRKTADAIGQEGGIKRWKIENEGFRTQKHAGFEMEHAYAKRPQTAKNFYLVLQIAHMLSQMLEVYCRGKAAVKKAFGSLRNLARAWLEAFRRDPIPDPESLKRFLDERIQIRFNTS